jgi:UDP-N-acetylmuramoylalanine--D-glutamate ligase
MTPLSISDRPLTGRRAIVVGLGASGRAAAELLSLAGASVVGNDRVSRERLGVAALGLEALGVRLELGGHAGAFWEGVDLVVVSPGVPDFPELLAAERQGVEVIGETELASRFLGAPILAIGGTNGKSTVTTLLGHMVEAAELRAFVGANLGEPACEAPRQNPEVVVFEVSSFQMERVPTFAPHVSVLLNISDDHLDRYDGFDAYLRAKGNAFANQRPEDFAVVSACDPRLRGQAERGQGRVVTFGADGDYRVEGASVLELETGHRFDLSGADLHGSHNHDNAAAAIAAARCHGLGVDAVEEGLARFRALPHRMALVGRHRGVAYYDDSKATNVGAAVTALRGLSEPRAVLVAGGRDKLGSYDELVEAVRDKGRAVVLLGEAADRIAAALGDFVPVERATSIAGAVQRAARLARPGDAVLLSPACSSLDMFKSYAERGDRFAEAVRELARDGEEGR